MVRNGARPADVTEMLDRGDLDGARTLLRRVFAEGPPSSEARHWAELCEAAGLSMLSLQAWQAVLAGGEADAVALEHLSQIHEERGDQRRAEACRQRLADLSGHPARERDPSPEADDPPGPPPGEPGDGDVVRFAQLFAGREGVHARQWQDPRRGGGYSPVHAPLSPDLVRAHLAGRVTLGIYVVRRDDTAGQLVLDLDARREALERAAGHPDRVAELAHRIHEAGLALLRGLRSAGFDPLLVDSGYKGRHLWCIFDPPEPARRARAVGEAWAAVLSTGDADLSIEVFPRQDHVKPGGLGNLVKLPLGIHLRTGRRCHLLGDDGQPLADPWERLRCVRKVPLEQIRRPPPRLVPAGAPAPGSGPAGDRGEEALPEPAPPAPPPPFTEADFESRPRLAELLAGCGVMRAVVRGAIEEGRLDRPGRLVLEHTMGHLPEGVEAINYLVERCGLEGIDRMKTPHSGNPASCRRVRQRLPSIAEREGCDCRFEDSDSYPTPMLHLLHLPARAPEQPDLQRVLDTLARLEARRVALEQELDRVRSVALERLQAMPGGRFESEAGTWLVEEREGVAALRFQRRARA